MATARRPQPTGTHRHLARARGRTSMRALRPARRRRGRRRRALRRPPRPFAGSGVARARRRSRCAAGGEPVVVMATSFLLEGARVMGRSARSPQATSRSRVGTVYGERPRPGQIDGHFGLAHMSRPALGAERRSGHLQLRRCEGTHIIVRIPTIQGPRGVTPTMTDGHDDRSGERRPAAPPRRGRPRGRAPGPGLRCSIDAKASRSWREAETVAEAVEPGSTTQTRHRGDGRTPARRLRASRPVGEIRAGDARDHAIVMLTSYPGRSRRCFSAIIAGAVGLPV